MMRWSGFRVESGPVVAPGVRLAVRQFAPGAACLEAELDEDGALLIAPPRVLARAGKVVFTPASLRLVQAQGEGSLFLGQASDGEIALVSLPPDATMLLAPGALLAATTPLGATRHTVGDTDEWILLRSGAERAALVAITSLGAVAHHALIAGEALDVAVGALLIADGAVDLAAGVHLDVPGSLDFLQCLGAGGIVVQAG